jgi:hypothetical protein
VRVEYHFVRMSETADGDKQFGVVKMIDIGIKLFGYANGFEGSKEKTFKSRGIRSDIYDTNGVRGLVSTTIGYYKCNLVVKAK